MSLPSNELIQFPSLASDDDLSTPNAPPHHRKESVIHHIRLRMLQAEIYQRLFTVAASKSVPPSTEWLTGMSQRLDQWRFGYFSQPDELLTPRWLDLHYNLSQLLLFRPNPGNPTPDQESLKRALAASSFLMRTYKAMWRQKTVNFVWLAIHHVFVAGVTYLNALWVAAKHEWEIVPSLIDAVLDIQSCSQVLEGMTGEYEYEQADGRESTWDGTDAGRVRGGLCRGHTAAVQYAQAQPGRASPSRHGPSAVVQQ